MQITGGKPNPTIYDQGSDYLSIFRSKDWDYKNERRRRRSWTDQLTCNTLTPKRLHFMFNLVNPFIDWIRNQFIKMHSLLQRGNSILAYALSVLAFLTFVCFASTVFLNYVTLTKIQTVKVVV